MRFLVTNRFRRAYKSLSVEERKRIQKALHLMSKDLRHPGLRIKRIRGTHGIWEARASRSLRITFEVDKNEIVSVND